MRSWRLNACIVALALGAHGCGSDDDRGEHRVRDSIAAGDAAVRDIEGGTDSSRADAAKAPVADASKGEQTQGGAASAGGPCTREALSAAVDGYFSALSAHDPSKLSLTPDVRFTENGMALPLGQGTLWTMAGALSFKRNVLDTERCSTLTQGVIERAGTPTIVGVRLKLAGSAISEVESYLVTGGFFNTPAGVSNDGNAAWEALLPVEQRSTREELNAIANSYFDLFSSTPPQVPFAAVCSRYENGTVAPGVMHCSDGIPQGLSITNRRFPIADLEAGIAVGFVLFAGSLDFHMFKVRSGEVVGIHALLASRATTSGWD